MKRTLSRKSLASVQGEAGEFILYQTEDGQTRIECRFENETIWLTQALLAELFQVGVNTINHHLKELYGDGELDQEATIRKYRIDPITAG